MEHTSVNVKEAIPFLMVLSMEKSLKFYLEVLGFELKSKWEPNGKIEWCLLRLGNASIMLQEYRTPPGEKLGVGVSVYFICTDALEIYNGLIARKINVQEPFVGNNMWVVSLKDPDGYDINFESLTDIPEETTYSEWVLSQKSE